MALSNSEKQAAFRARQAEKIASLGTAVETLTAENADLRAKLEKANARVLALQKKVKAMTVGKAGG